MKLSYIIIACACLFSGNVWSATITAVNSGNWTSNSTWSCNCQPGNGDNIVIPAGKMVTATGTIFLFLGPVINITIGGTLVLNNASLSIDSSDVVNILAGGKISGTGFFGGTVYSGLSPVGVSNGDDILGPKTITNGVLPIKLLYFRNTVNDDGVVLEWASSEEKNFDHYELSVSIDGKSFISITTVPGKNPNGGEYNYLDTSPAGKTSYYKLTAFDLDGTSEEMPVIKVEWSGREEWISIYPNPVSDGVIHARLFGGATGTLSLLDCNGMFITQNLVTNAFSSDLQLPTNIPPGAYFVSAQMGGKVVRVKVIVSW